MYLMNKKKERVLKISAVKLECSLSDSLKDNETQYITINQTILYQVLKKKVQLNQKNKLIYIALVDEKKRNKIKAKVLSKIQITSRIKSANKIYFKNTNTFNIKNNEKNNYVFYYGFQY